jgi:hypothetical protein
MDISSVVFVFVFDNAVQQVQRAYLKHPRTAGDTTQHFAPVR